MSNIATKFIVFSEFGELLDLAMHLKYVEGHEVLLHIPTHDNESIGEGIIEKVKNWHTLIGKGYVWIFDGCNSGSLQDWLRSKGEFVFGGTEKADRLENDRQTGQKLFKLAGFVQPESKNFTSIEEGLAFVKANKDRRWILKQNGDAPKSLNHMGKFDGSEDMVFHLEELAKRWNESEFGPVDFDLMEVVEGVEMAASAWFNGHNFIRNKQGKIMGYINFEDKKEVDGGLGETTGEMGTTFIGATEENALFADMMLRPKLVEALRMMNYRGVFDVNCIKTDKGMVALEPTCRFGVPATSYEFMEGLLSPTGELIAAVARGEDYQAENHPDVGMVMVIAAKPFPVENAHEDTSIGERLWILPAHKDFSMDQRKHIHLENFNMKDGTYRVATKSGYLLTVTGKGKTIASTRKALIQYIKDNLYIAGMKYRSDIGARVEEAAGLGTPEAQKESRANKEMQNIKQALKKAIYG